MVYGTSHETIFTNEFGKQLLAGSIYVALRMPSWSIR